MQIASSARYMYYYPKQTLIVPIYNLQKKKKKEKKSFCPFSISNPSTLDYIVSILATYSGGSRVSDCIKVHNIYILCCLQSWCVSAGHFCELNGRIHGFQLCAKLHKVQFQRLINLVSRSTFCIELLCDKNIVFVDNSLAL